MEVNTNTSLDMSNMYNNINGYFVNPTSFVIVALVLMLYVVLFLTLGKSNENNNTSTNNSSVDILLTITIVVFFILLFINGIQYFFGINIVASIKNLFTNRPEIDIIVQKDNLNITNNPVPEIVVSPQVFNIPGNYYGYDDAKTLCSAYGSRLATYEEIEESYNKGGEWCNYGWSDGQMALFPTQKKTFDNLQNIKGHEHDCGRPGVNGGYMSNPKTKFGVNCFGYKPKMTQEEEELMQVNTPYPKTEKDILMEKKIDYWKTKINDILVSPFNYNNWNKI
jgi:hypothetical protein